MIIIVQNGLAFATHADVQYPQVKDAYAGATLYFVPDGTQALDVRDDEGNVTTPVKTEAEVQAIGVLATPAEVMRRVMGLEISVQQDVLGITPLQAQYAALQAALASAQQAISALQAQVDACCNQNP